MRKTFAAFSAIAALMTAPVQVFCKGYTVRITINGETLGVPIEITDPSVVARFDVWSGPGTSPNQTEGLNVDWSGGVVEGLKDLAIYHVSFVTSRSDPSTYVVLYAVDPATKRGYVYIPGKADAGYRDNVRLIYRGIEGNWFHASREWEGVADPLIVYLGPCPQKCFRDKPRSWPYPALLKVEVTHAR